MKLEELIIDGKSNNFLKNMKMAVDILGEHILPYNTIVHPSQKRYLNVFCSYAFRYAIYIKELALSYNTLNFISINAIARSAVECYALTKFIYKHHESNYIHLFQTLCFPDLKELNSIIKNYETDSQIFPELEVQKTNNQIILENELKDYFQEGEQWLNQGPSNDQIIKEIRAI